MRDDNKGKKILKFGKKIPLYFEFGYSLEHAYTQLCQHAFKCSRSKVARVGFAPSTPFLSKHFMVEYPPPTPGFTHC
jgi:hypothetical protein